MGHSLKKQAGFLLASQIIAFIVISASPVILTRIMNPDELGLYQQALLICTVVVALTRFRLPGSLYYFYPRKKNQIDILLTHTVTLLLCAGVLGSVVVYLVAQPFNMFSEDVSGYYILPVCLFIGIEAVGQLLDHIFILEKQPGYVLLKGLLNNTVRLLLVVSAFLVFQSVVFMLYALVVHSALRFLIVIAYIINKYKLGFGFKNKRLLVDQLKYIAPLAAAGIVGVIGTKVDKAVVSYYMTSTEFAIYTLGGLGIMSSVTMLYTSVGNVCLPKLSEFADNNDLAPARELWHKMVYVNALVTIPVVIFCYVLAPYIIELLFTRKYIQSADIWRINFFVLIIQMVGYGYIPTAFGKTRSVLAGNLVRFIVAIPLTLVLVGEYGLVGAAVGFVAGFWANALVQLAAGKRALGVGWAELLPWKKILYIALVALVASGILPYVAEMNIVLLLKIALAGLVYFAIVLFAYLSIGFVKPADIRKLLKRP